MQIMTLCVILAPPAHIDHRWVNIEFERSENISNSSFGNIFHESEYIDIKLLGRYTFPSVRLDMCFALDICLCFAKAFDIRTFCP